MSESRELAQSREAKAIFHSPGSSRFAQEETTIAPSSSSSLSSVLYVPRYTCGRLRYDTITLDGALPPLACSISAQFDGAQVCVGRPRFGLIQPAPKVPRLEMKGVELEARQPLTGAREFIVVPKSLTFNDTVLGPFVVATMAMFFGASIKYKDDTMSPIFIVAVIGIGLWIGGFVSCLVGDHCRNSRRKFHEIVFAYTVAVITIVLVALQNN